jgi:hypothetical protein
MESQPITIQLDRQRQVRWTNRAQARNSSLPRPASFTMLARGKNRLYALCAILWAALVDRDHSFEEPEDLAEYLQTEQQQLAAIDAVRRIIEEAFPEKKSNAVVTSTAASETTAPSGPERSSNTALPVPTTGHSSPVSTPPSNSPASKSSGAKRATKRTS